MTIHYLLGLWPPFRQRTRHPVFSWAPEAQGWSEGPGISSVACCSGRTEQGRAWSQRKEVWGKELTCGHTPRPSCTQGTNPKDVWAAVGRVRTGPAWDTRCGRCWLLLTVRAEWGGSSPHVGSQVGDPVCCVYCEAGGLLGDQSFLLLILKFSYFFQTNKREWLLVANCIVSW